MSIDVGKSVDAVSSIVKAIGDTAQAALTAGDIVLPILQDISLIPVVGVDAAIVANYVSIALPYIKDVAQYAPAVSSGLENHKSMIEAAVGVGEALLNPLASLLADIPQLAAVHDFFGALDAMIKSGEFKPQDPRFAREDPMNY